MGSAKETGPIAGVKAGDWVIVRHGSGGRSFHQVTHVDDNEMFGGARVGKYSRVNWDGTGHIGNNPIGGRLATPEEVAAYHVEQAERDKIAKEQATKEERAERARGASSHLLAAVELFLKYDREPQDGPTTWDALQTAMKEAYYHATGERFGADRG